MSALRIRTVATTAVLATVTATVCGLAGLAPSAAAAAPVSQANGRFLSGQAGGTSFDTVASLNGESAAYPGNPGPNANGLSGSLLGQSIAGPTRNVSVPFPGGVTFGAVGQYAAAARDGSATSSSGLVGSNGAINVGGSGNSDTATVDLSKLPGASSLTDLLGNLTLHVGAVSSQAKQAAFGKKLSDPSAGCSNGGYLRVSNADHAGRYDIAHLTLTATSPLLTQTGSTLRTNLSSVISQLRTAAAASPIGGLVGGLPDPTQQLQVTLPGGGVTANLTTGELTIDLAKILRAAGLDLNNLCPNTSLVGYLAQALSTLPTKLSALFTSLSDSLNGVTVTLPGGIPLPTLSSFLAPFQSQLATNFQSVFTQFSGAFDPALNAITQNLLDLVVNAQGEQGGTFTETALQVLLIPNGGSLPSLPGLPTLPGLSPAALQRAAAAATAKAKQGSGSSAGGLGSTGSGTGSGGGAAPAPSSSSKGGLLPGVPLPGLPFAAGHLDLGPIQLAASASQAVIQLDLASASVTNAAPTGTTAPAAPTGTQPAEATGTQLPTGVPAGAAGHGGSPVAPLLIVLAGLVIAGAGLGGWRWRVGRQH